jgi:hypothetical protein
MIFADRNAAVRARAGIIRGASPSMKKGACVDDEYCLLRDQTRRFIEFPGVTPPPRHPRMKRTGRDSRLAKVGPLG